VIATGLAAVLLAAGVMVGIGAASAGPSSDAPLVEPHDDPFYAPPAGWQAAAPGTLLATRPVTVKGLGLTVPADAQQFLARSTAARMAGHGVLDGIRAAEALSGTGLTGRDTPVGLWGYSGGGLATSWAAELQNGYAPELKILGAASGGTPSDMGAAARNIDGTIASGLVLLASTGLTRAYPEMLSLLNDRGRAMVSEIGDMCVGDAVSRFPFRHLNEFTISKDPLSEPVAKTVMEDNHLGRLTPRAPVF